MAAEDVTLSRGLTPSHNVAHRVLAGRAPAPEAIGATDLLAKSAGTLRDAGLAGKTQVWFPAGSRNASTRGSHCHEVAEAARRVAAQVPWLDDDLAWTIGALHDIAHGPGGHSFERVANERSPDGWDHAVVGGKLVAVAGFPDAVCRAVAGHTWDLAGSGVAEGEVVSWVDRVCYLCSDLEDAERLAVLEPHAVRRLLNSVGLGSALDLRDGVLSSLVRASVRTEIVCVERAWAERLDQVLLSMLDLLYGIEALREQDTRVQALVNRALDERPGSMVARISAVSALSDEDLLSLWLADGASRSRDHSKRAGSPTGETPR